MGADTYFQIPHSENYRIRMPGSNWGNRRLWSMDPNSSVSGMDSARSTREGDYNERHWIFSVWADSTGLTGLTHHEWYPHSVSAGGVPGFNGGTSWICGMGHVNRPNGAARWAVTGLGHTPTSRRLVAVPEPSGAFQG